jgi:hypothetical protein
MTHEEAEAFATQWAAAWNTLDVELSLANPTAGAGELRYLAVSSKLGRSWP